MQEISKTGAAARDGDGRRATMLSRIASTMWSLFGPAEAKPKLPCELTNAEDWLLDDLGVGRTKAQHIEAPLPRSRPEHGRPLVESTSRVQD